jgi:hypothetical protein
LASIVDWYLTTSGRSNPIHPIQFEYEIPQVLNKNERLGAFDDHDATLLRMFAAQSAIAVQNSKLFAVAQARRVWAWVKQMVRGRAIVAAISIAIVLNHHALCVENPRKQFSGRVLERENSPCLNKTKQNVTNSVLSHPILSALCTTIGVPQRALAKSAALLEVTNAISHELDLAPLINIIVSKAQQLLASERCTVFLVDDEKDEPQVCSGGQMRGQSWPPNRGDFVNRGAC